MIGDVLVDVVVRPAEPVAQDSDTTSAITWRQGGSAATTAARLGRLGVPVRLAGRVGADAPGRWLATSLADGGVEVALTLDRDQPTGTVVAVVRGDERDMYTSRGAAAALQPADVDGLVEDAVHLHLSGYVLLEAATRAAGLAALAAATHAGVPVSVDPSSAGPLSSVGAGTFMGWLPRGVLLTPNADEAAVLSGLEDPTAAAVALADRCHGQAVVTLGAGGAVWSDGTSVCTCAVDAVVPDGDPVGAGDAFTAGLLHARLAGASVDAQLAAGCTEAWHAMAGT